MRVHSHKKSQATLPWILEIRQELQLATRARKMPHSKTASFLFVDGHAVDADPQLSYSPELYFNGMRANWWARK